MQNKVSLLLIFAKVNQKLRKKIEKIRLHRPVAAVGCISEREGIIPCSYLFNDMFRASQLRC